MDNPDNPALRPRISWFEERIEGLPALCHGRLSPYINHYSAVREYHLKTTKVYAQEKFAASAQAAKVHTQKKTKCAHR